MGDTRSFALGLGSYRRSEESWEEAGRPAATVTLRPEAKKLVIDISVRKLGKLTFSPASATNPYDNESPDINGDGVQLYFVDTSGASGWVLIPEDERGGEGGGKVRARGIDGWNRPLAVDASWQRTTSGYAVHVRLPFESGIPRAFALGVVVNEKPIGRERRRGQLVLGGAAGEFVYLRGDREDRDRLPRFHIVD
jgi:hypothetical protein